MKTIFQTMFALVTVASFSTAAKAQVRETPVTLGMVPNGNPQGFIQGSDDNGVTFSTVEGRAGTVIPYSKIRGEGLDKAIRIDARSEALADARALFQAADYAAAADAFGAVAREYAILLGVPQNFSSEALFYQIESLRRAGKFSEMVPLVNAPVAKTITTKLDESYQRLHTFHKLWALYGAKDMAGLKTALEAYQKPVLGEAKLLRTQNFLDLPVNELAQLAFLRAKVFESEKDDLRALEDYTRVFSLAFANDPFLSKQSMGAAMVITQRMNPDLAESKDKVKLRGMQSLAYTFSKLYGESIMPDQFKQFVVRPDMPKPPAPEPEEAKEGGDTAAAPAEGTPAADKPAEGDNPPAAEETKAKGEEKAKE